MAEDMAGAIPKRVFINSVDSYASRNIAKVSLITKMKDGIIWTRRKGSLIYMDIVLTLIKTRYFLTRHVTKTGQSFQRLTFL